MNDNEMFNKVLKKLHSKGRPEKLSKTLRFQKDLWNAFESLSGALKKHPADVLEAFMEIWVDEMVRRKQAPSKTAKRAALFGNGVHNEDVVTED